MRVLHGMSEVAGQGAYSVKGLRENGVDAKMAVWRKNPSGYPYDYCLNIGKTRILYPFYFLKMIGFALYAFFKFDCFHFHFGWSLLPAGIDLKILKLFKKKVFMEFHGSDIRWSFNREPYEHLEMPKENPKRQRKIKKILRHVDGVILHDEELRKHLPKTDTPIYIVPLRLDIKRFTPLYPSENVEQPVIVHAPSKRSNKGTEYVLAAIEKIKQPIKFVLVENKPQSEALEIYKSADIIIDQLLAGTYGVFTIESMALGKPVIVNVDEEMQKEFPEELPIVSANAETIAQQLEKLITDSHERRTLGIHSREYAEKYHDCKKNAAVLKKIYTGECPVLRGRDAYSYVCYPEITERKGQIEL